MGDSRTMRSSGSGGWRTPPMSHTMSSLRLTSAWQNSIKADQDFAHWARDEISGGCTSGNQSADPHAQAAAGPDALATTGKQAFVGQWNPVATRYGLPTYRWNQL